MLIFGPPRSGTSLLSRLIDAHSNISIPFESHLFNQWWPRRGAYGDLQTADGQRELLADIIRFGVVRDWSPLPVLDEVVEFIDRPGFDGASRALLTWWAHRCGGTRWGEKTPHHLMLHETVLDVWNDAQVVFILRDPRDAILSWKNARFGARHVLPLAKSWVKYATAYQNCSKLLDSSTAMTLRYEELVRDPETQTKRVMDHLGERYESVQAEFYTHVDGFHTDKRNATRLQQQVNTDSVGRYKAGLTSREVRIIESIAGDLMRQLGYEPENADADVTPMEQAVSRYIEHPTTRVLGILKNRQGFGYLARDIGWETSRIKRSIVG